MVTVAAAAATATVGVWKVDCVSYPLFVADQQTANLIGPNPNEKVGLRWGTMREMGAAADCMGDLKGRFRVMGIVPVGTRT